MAPTPHKRSADENLLPKLTSHVKEFLPTYMVPSAFVVLESFPLTPNGKIDKKALPLPEAAPRKTTEAYAVPSSDLEKSIAGIWKDMLGVDRVGRKDNIFDLGASSLITVEANNRLQSLLGKKIPLVTMFRYPTVESLATHLGASGTQGAPSPVQAPALDAGRQDRMSQAAERRRRARAQAP